MNTGIKPLAPFIVSTVPKSGTHLIQQILNGLPGVSNDISDMNKKFFVNNPPTGLYEDHWQRLNALKPNEFGIGHLHYSKEYVEMLRKLKMKHIFVYRDPRDVLVSLIYFIPDMWGEHPFHHPFKTMTKKERVLTLINGIEGKFPNFLNYFGPFYDWLGDSNSLHISFESLMSSNESRSNTMSRLIEYLWTGQKLPETPDRIIHLMENKINPTQSRTFRKGKIGSWREEFDVETKEAFKKVCGQLLIQTGYEKDNNW